MNKEYELSNDKPMTVGEPPMASTYTKRMIPIIREYLRDTPIVKAWLFGSCSRGDDNKDSDVDIIVQYDKNANVSLFTIGGIYMDLKSLLKREVDLVEDGTLMPFANETANRDKVLIYER